VTAVRAKEFERSDLDKVMEVYEEFCKDRRGFKIANKVMPSIEAVNQGMEVEIRHSCSCIRSHP
jgi:hypothetical protein